MKRIDIVKRGNQWIGESNRVVVTKAPTKEAAIKATAAVAKADSNAVTAFSAAFRTVIPFQFAQ